MRKPVSAKAITLFGAYRLVWRSSCGLTFIQPSEFVSEILP